MTRINKDFNPYDPPREVLCKYFHLRSEDAAKGLGICTTLLKKICRRYGIRRWPYRKISAIENAVTRSKCIESPDVSEKINTETLIIQLKSNPNARLESLLPKNLRMRISTEYRRSVTSSSVPFSEEQEEEKQQEEEEKVFSMTTISDSDTSAGVKIPSMVLKFEPVKKDSCQERCIIGKGNDHDLQIAQILISLKHSRRDYFTHSSVA